MEDNHGFIEEMTQEERGKLILDFFHRTIIHHTLWFSEVKHQMGEKRALKKLENVSKRSLQIQLSHLGKLFGFEMEGELPLPLLQMEKEKQLECIERLAKNWLVSDGVWFQEVERTEGMNEAKRCNDSCWAQFSPFEAASIKNMLSLKERPGIDGLKKALNYRLYGAINAQSVHDEDDKTFTFQMNNCRVQAARKRKGLEDYPCKSAGLVEYSYFARAIDERIETECIGCPPDAHPDEWFCAWRFTLKEEE